MKSKSKILYTLAIVVLILILVIGSESVKAGIMDNVLDAGDSQNNPSEGSKGKEGIIYTLGTDGYGPENAIPYFLRFGQKIDLPGYCLDPTKGSPHTDNVAYTVVRINDSTYAKSETQIRMMKYVLGHDLANGHELKLSDYNIVKQLACWEILFWDDNTNLAEKTARYTKYNVDRNAVLKLLDEAKKYANEVENYNNNKYVPTISGKNATIEQMDNGLYKLGPFKLNYYENVNLNKIQYIKIFQNGKQVEFDNNGYLYSDGKRGNALPKPGEEFYCIVKNFNINNGVQVKITLGHSYYNYEDIKLYVATRVNNAGNKCQPVLIAEGKPNKGTVDQSIDLDLREPADYTLDLTKIDGNQTSLNGAEFEIKLNGERINNKASITAPLAIKITVDTIGKDIIEIRETKAPEGFKKLSGTLKLEVAKIASGNKYMVSSVKILETFKDEKGNNVQPDLKYNSQEHIINLKIQNEREMIKLSGYVWEDEKQGKESALNGMKDSSEKYINGITVTCYSMDGKNILYTNSNTKTAITGMNNKDGYYEFEVPKTKEGYYIGFTYNGQNYQHTKYTRYDGKNSSNATEDNQARRYMNSLLEEIYANKTVKDIKINNKINEQDATYIKDSCYAITAYTGDKGQNKAYIKTFNTTSEHIDLGITKREIADLAIRKDVYKTTLSIKGKTQDYIYNKRENLETDANGNLYWDIKVRQSDNYYKDNYTREIRTSDYNYQGENGLTAEVVYKIIVRNQSGLLDTKLTELVDYYDKDYIYKEAYILDNNTKKNIIPSENSKYGPDNHNITINGYQKIYLDMSDITIKANSQIELYVVFRVNTDNNGKLLMDLDENNLGKGNIVEIMGYKTYYTKEAIPPNYGSKITDVEYKEGYIAGRVDIDSNPGNTTSENENNFEDDTDKAPYIKFSFAQTGRSVKGTVWKDNRTELEANAATGNGIKDNGEELIDGVTVELWDIDTNSIAKIWDGTKWVDARTTSSKDNGYEINNFVPGNYYIKFIYKDGQNYKSTVFNYDKVLKTSPDKLFDVNNPDDLTFEYNETTDKNYSDARDIWGDENTSGTRAYVNNKYISKGIITNSTENELNEELEKGKCSIQAITGTLSINFESDSNNTNSDSGRLYELNNIDLGLQERAKAQLMITKEINNVKVILANGSILFDANGKATNVMWHDKKTHTNGYNRNLMNEPKVVNNNPQVLLTMDSELMHGANIKINYKISVKNIGEVDYVSKQFYYTGKKLSEDEAATTTVYDIVDYAGASGTEGSKISINNLKFSANENSGWIPVTSSELKQKGFVHIVDNNKNDITSNIDKYSTILKYSFGENGLGKELKPQIENPEEPNEYSVETYLTLSQVMTADNKDDDLKYGNMVEILSLKNSMGRMQYSTVGNQNPNDDIKEVDSDLSQLTILPPFGEKNIYYVLGIGIAIICISGIIIIKKKALKK